MFCAVIYLINATSKKRCAHCFNDRLTADADALMARMCTYVQPVVAITCLSTCSCQKIKIVMVIKLKDISEPEFSALFLFLSFELLVHLRKRLPERKAHDDRESER